MRTLITLFSLLVESIRKRRFQSLTTFLTQYRVIKVISLTATAGILAAATGLVGSLVQANFISPEQLGFVRKYAIVSSITTFASLGLLDILQREYPRLLGRGDRDLATKTAAVIGSWIVLIVSIICGALALLAFWYLLHNEYLEAAGLGIQIVVVWSTLYIGYVSSTYRSSHSFSRLAVSQLLSSATNLIVLPLFWLVPIPAFIIRSISGLLVYGSFLHLNRPIRVRWYLPWTYFVSLAKQSLKLFFGTYLRYNFWLALELWLMLKIGGNEGVGLLVFSKTIVEAAAQLSIAINQVYLPRVAQHYGKTSSIESCLRFSTVPTLLSFALNAILVSFGIYLMPLIIARYIPSYVAAIPLVKILLLQLFIFSISLPVYSVILLRDYKLQNIAAVTSLLIFIGITQFLSYQGFGIRAVALGTVIGQVAFVVICLIGVLLSINHNKAKMHFVDH